MIPLHVTENKSKIVHRVDLIGTGGRDDAVESGGGFRAVHLVKKDPILLANGERSDLLLHAIIVDL